MGIYICLHTYPKYIFLCPCITILYEFVEDCNRECKIKTHFKLERINFEVAFHEKM